MSWTMQDFSPCSVFVRAPLPPCPVKRYKCIGQIEASTSPRVFDFFENCCSNSPLSKPNCRSNAPHQGPFRWSNALTPGTFHRHMNWQKDGKHAFSCRTKYLSIQQPASKLSCLGKRSGPRENARARGRSSATRGFAARSRVLARLASLAQIGELARRL